MDAILKAPFPVDLDLQSRLGRALESHRPAKDKETSDLRGAVIAATVALRATGMSAEGSLLTLKALAYDVGRVDALPPRMADHLIVSDDLMSDVVRWCVEGYFDEVIQQ